MRIYGIVSWSNEIEFMFVPLYVSEEGWEPDLGCLTYFLGTR